MKTVFYNATLHDDDKTIIEGVISEEYLIKHVDYTGTSWGDFYYAVKQHIRFINDSYNITLNQFSKLEG